MTDLRRHVPPLTLVWDDEAPGALHRTVDGTLVFADVSGFTALTERLSRQGRIGAEEIVEALNRVFGPMLTIAATRGGELLKFGGDALLFLFRGDDHAQQACDAAVEMRTSLRAAAAVPTSAGRFSLSMSVGVHAGDIELFLVGSPTRELLVLGPGASAVALAEKAADAGQVVVSPATAARLPRGSTRPRDDGALLLRRRLPRTEPGRPTPVPADPEQRMATLFPTALGEFLAPGPPDPEHRVATIAFVRFSGTDTVLAQQGPQELAERLHEVVSTVEQALEAEGVTLLATDLDTDGGKFFLGAGVPGTRGDDEGRMLRALRRVADAGLPLPLQLGVARGNVFAAEVGVPDRAAYSAMGDTTNTAARIMGTAPIGTVHAHPAVLERSHTLFAVTPRGPFRMKGKAAPVLVYEVGEEVGTREAAGTTRLPFLGRDAELATARTALEEALSGEGGVVVVEGPAGIGCTRLALEALDAAGVSERLALRAEPYGSSSAYRVLRDPLRALLGIARGSREEMGAALLAALHDKAPGLLPMAPLLADVLSVGVPDTPEADRVDPQYRADRVADVVIELLDRLAPGRFAVVVEDAHWADGASVHLLGRLAAATSGHPRAVVVVRRGGSDGFAPASGTRIVLDPLPDDVVEKLVIAATEATPLRPHEVAAVVAKAGGNPLFVEEVTRLALGAGSLEELPESVQAAMGAQVDELPPGARRILRYCAVLGLSVRREVLEGTLAADGLVLDRATLATLGNLVEADGPDRLRFRTSLVRDAAYDGLAYRVRARVHGTAGGVLERLSTDLDADSPALVLHFARAGDAPRTWDYAQRAGRLAEASYANADAADHLETALDVSRRLPAVTDAERARLWAKVGDLRELAGMFTESVEAYRAAARLTRADPVATADVLSRQAAAHLRTGAFTTTLRVVTRARGLLDGSDVPTARRTRVRLDNLTAVVRVEQQRPREAREWAIRAMEAAGAAGEHETQVRALMLVDMAEMQLGVPGLGARHREALEICVKHGLRSQEAKVRSNLGTMAYYAGRWSEAAQWYRSSRDVAMEAGSAFVAAQTDVNLGELLINQGHLDEAQEVLVSAVRVLRASGAVIFLAEGRLQLARVHLSRGDLAEAERRAAEVVSTFSGLDNHTSALDAGLVQAEAVLRSQRPVDALAIIDGAERAAGADAAFSMPGMCLQRARALLALGRLDEAAEQVEVGLVAAREQELPYEEALLLQVGSATDLRRGLPTDAAYAQSRSEELLARLGAVG
ncbi:MAG TPA: adenylate/guanylate cyclase domain-containing protein [Ornithinibacter sp.]|nr:adenylate/guanylate cyclase domain-containing protein [Ornithinibacter sp.]